MAKIEKTLLPESLGQLAVRRAPLVKELWGELKGELGKLAAALCTQLETPIEGVDQTVAISVTDTQIMAIPFQRKEGASKARARSFLYVTWRPSRDEGCEIDIMTTVGSSQTGVTVGASAVRARVLQLCKAAGVVEPSPPTRSSNQIWKSSVTFADPDEIDAIEQAFRKHVEALPHVLQGVQEHLDAKAASKSSMDDKVT